MDHNEFPVEINGAFSDQGHTVINYKGENYYLACGEIVTGNMREGTTTCVKRASHPSFNHEDWYGTSRNRWDPVIDIARVRQQNEDAFKREIDNPIRARLPYDPPKIEIIQKPSMGFITAQEARDVGLGGPRGVFIALLFLIPLYVIAGLLIARAA
jgi:hypothetical protein